MEKERLKRIWYQMKYRCYNKNSKSYKTYGEKGIKVCNEWLNSFESFYKWAINNGYQNNLTIDRIKNSKGYSPDNCRWVTKSFNSAHTSRWGKEEVITYTYNGITKTIGEWAKSVGMSYKRLRDELKKEQDLEKILAKQSVKNHIYLNKHFRNKI